jgi:hypothetical protein
MQASVREEIACRLFGSLISVEVPDTLAGRVRSALERLHAGTSGDRGQQAGNALEPGLTPIASCLVSEQDAISIRLASSPAGWKVESAGRRSAAANEEEAVIRLQEMLLESAASRAGEYLLFRGSIVARGSQTLLIAGDRGSTHAAVAIALTVLGFRLVSVGTAAFEGRSLVPLPLPLAFSLGPQDQKALAAAGLDLSEHLEALSGGLFCPRSVEAGLEPTHVLFPEMHAGSLSVVRPVAAVAARSRLCQLLLAAPSDAAPFAAVASLVRHTRGIHLTLGDIAGALGQLGRLLPRWSMQ